MSNHARIIGLVGLLGALAGCGEGLTTQEAYAACEDLLGRSPVEGVEDESSEVFLGCVACHEDCGRSCAMSSDAPPAFTCPEE